MSVRHLIDVGKLQTRMHHLPGQNRKYAKRNTCVFCFIQVSKGIGKKGFRVRCQRVRGGKNAAGWLKDTWTEGVIDRAVTRDLIGGIDVPWKVLQQEENTTKCLGLKPVFRLYHTATMKLLQDKSQLYHLGKSFGRKGKRQCRCHYLSIGKKTQISWSHTIILPALLMGWHIPTCCQHIYQSPVESTWLTLVEKDLDKLELGEAIWIMITHPDSVSRTCFGVYFLINSTGAGKHTKQRFFMSVEFLERNNGRNCRAAEGNLLTDPTQVRKNLSKAAFLKPVSHD